MPSNEFKIKEKSFNNIENEKLNNFWNHPLNSGLNKIVASNTINKKFSYNQPDELEINNINHIIKNTEKENISKSKEIIDDINSSLDIIKEEQNESDKISEKEKEYLFNSQMNRFNNLNNGNKKLISIGKLINESINENEKEINEISEHIYSLLNSYNNNLINNIIDLDIDTYKNEIDNFILTLNNKIEKLNLLDTIYKKIKEELIINYEIIEIIQKNNINEYAKLKDYEEKLDYIISYQNILIKELELMNTKLNENIKKSSEKEESIMIEDELVQNINKTSFNLYILNNLINDNYTYVHNKRIDLNLDFVNDLKISKDCSFFEVLEKIYNPLKIIKNEYQKKILLIEGLNNKNEYSLFFN